jgi:hypothetical protein
MPYKEEIVAPQMTFRKPDLLITLAFSILAFGAGFGISYQQDFAHAGELGQMAWLHLIYAEELKDDMAVIDWSKNLQKFDDVLVLQAMTDKKVIAEGGNRNFLPTLKKDGVYFSFPHRWDFHKETMNFEKKNEGLTVVYQLWPGPIIWGLLAFSLCLVTGLGTTGLASLFSPAKISKPPLTVSLPKPKVAQAANRPQNIAHLKSEKPFLFLDKNYVIQQVTPEAARLLNQNSDDLLNGHLFDLNPAPNLMQAIEKAEETKLLSPFLINPNLSAFLKPDPNGTLLYLEISK